MFIIQTFFPHLQYSFSYSFSFIIKAKTRFIASDFHSNTKAFKTVKLHFLRHAQAAILARCPCAIKHDRATSGHEELLVFLCSWCELLGFLHIPWDLHQVDKDSLQPSSQTASQTDIHAQEFLTCKHKLKILTKKSEILERK